MRNALEDHRDQAAMKLVLAATAVMAIVLTAVILTLTTAAPTKSAAPEAASDVTGMIASDFMRGDGRSCEETRTGITSGMPVRVDDAGGKPLGSSLLHASDSSGGGCYLYFDIPGVPVGTEYYTLKAGCLFIGFKGDQRYVSTSASLGCATNTPDR